VGSVGMSVDFLRAFAGESSKATGIDNLIHRLEREEFDLIAVGRALLADPQWVTNIRSGDQSGLKDFNPATLAKLF
jgi:2,4-dienoyl-CoA reductase-like NADH-dependent reductase (Old Yellow Enzyme family)